jgi:hypothetical protein
VKRAEGCGKVFDSVLLHLQGSRHFGRVCSKFRPAFLSAVELESTKLYPPQFQSSILDFSGIGNQQPDTTEPTGKTYQSRKSEKIGPVASV